MKDLRSSALVITILAAVSVASAQAPETNASPVESRDYTNRIQFHDVDLGLENPQDESSDADGRRDKDYDPLLDESVSRPVFLPSQRREQEPQRRLKDKDKAKIREQEKKKESGWGWLADDVAEAEKKAGGKSDAASDAEKDRDDVDAEREDDEVEEERRDQSTPANRYEDAFYAPDFSPRSGAREKEQAREVADRESGTEHQRDGASQDPTQTSVPEETASWLQPEDPGAGMVGITFDSAGTRAVVGEPESGFQATSFEPALDAPTILPGEAGGFQPLMPDTRSGFEPFDGGGFSQGAGSYEDGGSAGEGALVPNFGGEGIRVEPSSTIDSDQPRALPW